MLNQQYINNKKIQKHENTTKMCTIVKPSEENSWKSVDLSINNRLHKQINCSNVPGIRFTPAKSSAVHTIKPHSSLRVCDTKEFGNHTIPNNRSFPVQPQKSFESCDSATSGMSWDSISNLITTHSQISSFNSNSLSSSASILAYDENQHLESAEGLIMINKTSSPTASFKISQNSRMNLQKHSSQLPNLPNRPLLKSIRSCDEPRKFSVNNKLALSGNVEQQTHKPLRRPSSFEDIQLITFDGNKSPSCKKKSKFKKLWHDAISAIKNNSYDGKKIKTKISTTKHILNQELDEQTVDEIDPIYKLLKSAATSQYTTITNATECQTNQSSEDIVDDQEVIQFNLL